MPKTTCRALFKFAAFALIVQSDWRLVAQTVSIDTSSAGQQQVIDGFGTCLSGTEASQTTCGQTYIMATFRPRCCGWI